MVDRLLVAAERRLSRSDQDRRRVGTRATSATIALPRPYWTGSRRCRAGSQARARSNCLCSRPGWALKLLESIDRKTIPAAAVSRELVRRLRQYDDPQLVKLVEKTLGKGPRGDSVRDPGTDQRGLATALQAPRRCRAGANRSSRKPVRPATSCTDRERAVGPDLTAAERKNREVLVQNIVDPSAVIRQEFLTHVAMTKDGQVLTGLLAESTADTITLVDSKNQRTVLNRGDLEELKESPVSLMPEKLLDDLTDQQIRDLVAYFQAENTALPSSR